MLAQHTITFADHCAHSLRHPMHPLLRIRADTDTHEAIPSMNHIPGRTLDPAHPNHAMSASKRTSLHVTKPTFSSHKPLHPSLLTTSLQFQEHRDPRLLKSRYLTVLHNSPPSFRLQSLKL